MIFRYNGIEVKTMKDKCQKYEGLFIFGDEKDFLSHIETCGDCRAEHERMKKVSALIQEAAPQLRKKRQQFARLKLACASFVLILCVSTLGIVNLNTDIHDTLLYGQTLSVEDYGFPVDSYGLIMVN